jgi:hypothetical protein
MMTRGADETYECDFDTENGILHLAMVFGGKIPIDCILENR